MLNSTALLILRSLALLFSLQGRTVEANTINLLADAASSGKNVDDAMAVVAEKIRTGEPLDWEDLKARIEAASTVLHAP